MIKPWALVDRLNVSYHIPPTLCSHKENPGAFHLLAMTRFLNSLINFSTVLPMFSLWRFLSSFSRKILYT